MNVCCLLFPKNVFIKVQMAAAIVSALFSNFIRPAKYVSVVLAKQLVLTLYYTM